MANDDLDEFFQKVGSDYDGCKPRICGRTRIRIPYKCSRAVTAEPMPGRNMHCETCSQWMVICTCREFPGNLRDANGNPPQRVCTLSMNCPLLTKPSND